MKSTDATRIFAALSHERRLAVFRLLVQAGPQGMAASAIARRLKIQPATLSFHLKELATAGLVKSRQEGRFIYYLAHYAVMNRTVDFLLANCCGGEGWEAAPAERRAAANRRTGS